MRKLKFENNGKEPLILNVRDSHAEIFLGGDCGDVYCNTCELGELEGGCGCFDWGSTEVTEILDDNADELTEEVKSVMPEPNTELIAAINELTKSINKGFEAFAEIMRR